MPSGDAEPLIALRVDIDGDGTAQDHGSHHTAVHVARQDDLFSPLCHGEDHALHGGGRAPHHEERMGCAEGFRRQLLRIPNHRNGMAEIIERFHGVDIHGHAAFPQELRQLRIAAAPLVAGHIKRNDTHPPELLQRLIDRRALL